MAENFLTDDEIKELRKVKGTIFNIQHYCIHDGPGVRTNVFVKGCPLRCIWCANPESQITTPQLMYRSDKCVGCGACVEACPRKAVTMVDGKSSTDRALCEGCGKCVKVCKPEAREIMGYSITAGEAFDKVAKEKIFYGDDGGLTVTGGEALAHPEFTLALLKLCKNDGIGTAIETCGHAKWDIVKRVLAFCDTVLFDIKETDSRKHEEFTCVGNELILENLERINNELDCAIWVRVPTIPGYNADEENIRRIGELVSSRITRCSRVDLLPFHNLGESKAEQLDRDMNGFHSEVPSKEFMDNLKEIIRGFGLNCP
ncbi:MAG: glycyl-radical enzyme activating protein [Lachnospiraceae bacterium]|nr:glycyl-radical enzyme activating protein [Lachnospiraceae bacterium]